MGHQESLMFCANKRNMLRLCELLNNAAMDKENGLEACWLSTCEVARLKKDIYLHDPMRPLRKLKTIRSGTYFVWWAGERGPQRDDSYLMGFAHGNLARPCWETVFAEYAPCAELLAGIPDGDPGKIHENELMRTFHPERDNIIDLDLVEHL